MQTNAQPMNSFVGGLLTESGELTFPENASVDELNCDLQRDGSRRRRLGLKLEDGYDLSAEVVGSTTLVSIDKWENVGEQAGVEFVVVQVGSDLIFYEQTDGALSANRVDTTFASGTPYTLDMTAFEKPTANGAEEAEVQVTSVKGALVVSSPEINTFYVTRDPSTGAFTETEIDFRVRDYSWLGDKSTYDTSLASGSITDDRLYDTKNAGWSDGPDGVGDSALTTYISANTAYPPITHAWFAGKNASGDFSVTEWERIYSGTSIISNGHYILDLYSRDRETAAGLADDTYNTTEDSRFSCTAGYAGRVFYSGMSNSTDRNGSKIYFSRTLIDGLSGIGDCHQTNDPTAENFSDLLDTDGGFILIPEAYNIKVLHTFGPDLYVFAENGVWRIGGVDDVFRATNYTVSKMTEDGIASPTTFVSAQGRPYWWSESGIFTVSASQQTGQLEAQDISVSTIQTFWDDIELSRKALARGAYDPQNRRIYWLFGENGETNINKKVRVLVFDEVLGAFFPWKISDNVASNFLVDVVYDEANTTLKVMAIDGVTNSLTFAEFSDTTFLDWSEADYSSYVEGAFNFMGDMEMRKTMPYLTTFFKTTEEGWEADGDGFNILRDSGCTVKAYWDFKMTPTAGQEAYRRKHVPVVNESDLSSFDYPKTVVITRLKVRGRGRVMNLRFESQAGKDFHLLGYNVLSNTPGRY